ncbi:MAG: YbhB/YbcL family Raf kinase inhibitor-like protein [Actinobacteria bacterium]|nr:YbhB/YbcL family Raf kinase inhibitor-like protein [Actinomycetota bacterium]
MGLNIGDLQVSSPAFERGGAIPREHAKDGDDVSPPLEWSGVPDEAQQLAVICHDPDAPLPRGFTHWVLYGIPADTTAVPGGGGGQFVEGTNDFGDEGYGGPQPPPGHGTHHYYFWVYALDTELDLKPGLTRDELLDDISDHIVEQNRLIGTYET